MKNIRLLSTFFIFVLFCCSVSIAQEFDFRQANWGMSKAEVRAVEKQESIDEDIGGVQEIIAYNAKIASFDSYLGYVFVKNKLSGAGYYIQQEHVNKNDYIDDYNKLKDLLTQKYGKPAIDEVLWKNPLYKDQKEDWGFAISVGDLVYIAFWDTPSTEISLSLEGDNYEINFYIRYVSKELKSWVQEVIQEETLQDL
jgi:hypothetical protein